MVRVTPGMLPPTIRTTPNSPSVWAKLRTTPVRIPAHERTDDANEGAQSGHAEAPRRLDQAPVHAREGRREWSNRKGETVEDGGEQQALERKGEDRPRWLLGASKGAQRTNGDQDVEAEHSGRQDHGKHDDGFEQKFQAPSRKRQPVCKRGSPKTNKVSVVHPANCTLSQTALKIHGHSP